MELTRTKKLPDSQDRRETVFLQAVQNPTAVIRELNNRSLYHFIEYFWPVYSSNKFQGNWHIELICKELEDIAERRVQRLPAKDIIINVPPGTSKTAICSIFFPIWCWTKWPWIKFITISYSSILSLESADYSRDVIKSQEFQQIYPGLEIKADKDNKSNYRICKKEVVNVGFKPRIKPGGNRFSTSVGGTLTGFHADIIIVDDPINPEQAASEIELLNANRWMEQTLPTRMTDKDITPTILIMQRLHQNDPAGHLLETQNKADDTKSAEKVFNIKHLCLPGEIRNYAKFVNPPELKQFYVNDLLDVNRLGWGALNKLESKLGQYGYAGQIGQNPVPPGGGMFKVEHFHFVDRIPERTKIISTIRYWDKAGTQGAGAYTAGVKMGKLSNGFYIILDVKRGQWATHERENIILETALADGYSTEIWLEQEPGSSGKESAENTIRNLAGFKVRAERPTGPKEERADPFSVQVNHGNVYVINGPWVSKYVEELRHFPFSTYKDQTDASSGAFQKLIGKKIAGRVT
jgi:predicted phage terminase large subunit-like protein